MKNNFSKLRRQKRITESKLNLANRTVKIQIDEIAKLNKELDIKDITINSLKIKEKDLSDKIERLFAYQKQVTREKNKNYQWWMEEHEINRKLNISLIVSVFVIIGFVGTVIGLVR